MDTLFYRNNEYVLNETGIFVGNKLLTEGFGIENDFIEKFKKALSTPDRFNNAVKKVLHNNIEKSESKFAITFEEMNTKWQEEVEILQGVKLSREKFFTNLSVMLNFLTESNSQSVKDNIYFMKTYNLKDVFNTTVEELFNKYGINEYPPVFSYIDITDSYADFNDYINSLIGDDSYVFENKDAFATVINIMSVGHLELNEDYNEFLNLIYCIGQ